MKISQLIKQLNEIMEQKGDLQVKDEALRNIVLAEIEKTGDEFVTLYTE